MTWNVIGRHAVKVCKTVATRWCLPGVVWALSLALAAPVSATSEASQSVSTDVLNLPAQLRRDKGYYLFRLSLQQGDYIRGFIQGEGAFHGWLSTPDQAFWRHLNRYGDTFARFHWVAPKSGIYFLEVDADHAWEIRLSQLNRLPFDPLKPPHKSPQSPLIQQAIERLQAGQSEDKVWSELVAEGTPLVEPLAQYAEQAPHQRLVTFLWRGAQHNVQFLGALGNVNRDLYRLPYSRDIWFRTYQMPDDTRMSYQLAPDVPHIEGDAPAQEAAALATAQRDPYNPDTWGSRWDKPFDHRADPFLMKSILALDRASQDTYLDAPETPLPFMQRYHFNGSPGRGRQVDLWQPDGLVMKDGMSIPLVVFLNGSLYQHEVSALRVLHNLMRERLIPPVMVAWVQGSGHTFARGEVSAQGEAFAQGATIARGESACDPEFADFLAHKLLPVVQRETGNRLLRNQILLVGADYGGLAAACAAYRYPQYFGMVLSQSGAFWWHPHYPDESEALMRRYEQSDPQRPLRFYFSAGLFERDFDGGPGVPSATRHLAQTLTRKGHLVTLEMFNAGHDAYHWRTTLWRGLLKLLGPLSTQVKMPRTTGAND